MTSQGGDRRNNAHEMHISLVVRQHTGYRLCEMHLISLGDRSADAASAAVNINKD